MEGKDDDDNSIGPRQHVQRVLEQLYNGMLSDSEQEQLIEREFGSFDALVNVLMTLYNEEQQQQQQQQQQQEEEPQTELDGDDDGGNGDFLATSAGGDRNPNRKRKRTGDDQPPGSGDTDIELRPSKIPKLIPTPVLNFLGKLFGSVVPATIPEAGPNKIELAAIAMLAKKKLIKHRIAECDMGEGRIDGPLLLINFLFSFMVSNVNDTYSETYAYTVPKEADPRTDSNPGISKQTSQVSISSFVMPQVGYDPHDYPARIHTSAERGCLQPFVSAGVNLTEKRFPGAKQPAKDEMDRQYTYLQKTDCLLQTLATVESSSAFQIYRESRPLPSNDVHSLVLTTPWQLYRLTPEYGTKILNARFIHGDEYVGPRHYQAYTAASLSNIGILLNDKTGASTGIFDKSIDAALLEDAGLALPAGSDAEKEQTAMRDTWAVCNLGSSRRRELFDPMYPEDAADNKTRGFMRLLDYSQATASNNVLYKEFLFQVDKYSLQACHYAPTGKSETCIITDLARALAMSAWCRHPSLPARTDTAYGSHVTETMKILNVLLGNQRVYAERVHLNIISDPPLRNLYDQYDWKSRILHPKESDVSDKWLQRKAHVLLYFPQRSMKMEFRSTKDESNQIFTFDSSRIPSGTTFPHGLANQHSQLNALLRSLYTLQDWLFRPGPENVLHSLVHNVEDDDNDADALYAKALLEEFGNGLLRWVVTLDDVSEKLLRSGVIRQESTWQMPPVADRQSVTILKTPAVPEPPNVARFINELKSTSGKLPIYGIGVFIDMTLLTSLDRRRVKPGVGGEEKKISHFRKAFDRYIAKLDTAFRHTQFGQLAQLPMPDSPLPAFLRAAEPVYENPVRLPQFDEPAQEPIAREVGSDDEGEEEEEEMMMEMEPDRSAVVTNVLNSNRTKASAAATPMDISEKEEEEEGIQVAAAVSGEKEKQQQQQQQQQQQRWQADANTLKEQFAGAVTNAMISSHTKGQQRNLQATTSYYQECVARKYELRKRELDMLQADVKRLQAERDQLRREAATTQ